MGIMALKQNAAVLVMVAMLLAAVVVVVEGARTRSVVQETNREVVEVACSRAYDCRLTECRAPRCKNHLCTCPGKITFTSSLSFS
ncbi:hypothetical protein RND81_02G223800 [Saponaria officinalis]|uniref:Uncharacterized protein n=1 Tax=Saponaria officinalis TaxID=3572 RepID=A0AAW1MN89_SAPOF